PAEVLPRPTARLLRARPRASRRAAAAGRRFLHDERRHLRRLLRVRPCRRAVIVGLLHPGEMGSAIGAALQSVGHEIVWASAGRSEATRSRASTFRDLGSVHDVARDAPVSLAVCARTAAPALAR